MMSSTCAVSSPLRSRIASSTRAARRGVGTSCSAPSFLPLPRGVRTASKTYASAISALLKFVGGERHHCCGTGFDPRTPQRCLGKHPSHEKTRRDQLVPPERIVRIG